MTQKKPMNYVIPSSWLTNLKGILRGIYIAKNHDYGNSAYDTWKYYGDIALLIRIEDKLRRLETLSKCTAEVKEESIEDTYLDAINYAIILAGCNKTPKHILDDNFTITLEEFDEVFSDCVSQTIVGSDDNWDRVEYFRKHFKRRWHNSYFNKYEAYAVLLIRCYYTWCLNYKGITWTGEVKDESNQT